MEGALQGDRLAGLGVVVEGLTESHAEREHEECERDADPPSHDFVTSAAPAALVALDR